MVVKWEKRKDPRMRGEVRGGTGDEGNKRLGILVGDWFTFHSRVQREKRSLESLKVEETV